MLILPGKPGSTVPARRDQKLGVVYLIHFDRAYGSGKQLHYLGWCDPGFAGVGCMERMKKHRSGTGAVILRNLNNRGISWKVVRKWPNQTTQDEERMKKWNKLKQFCPVCSPLTWKEAGSTQEPRRSRGV